MLRFSEDAAARRAGAAKLVKRFPLVLECIANGELHLTGLLLLGPHLTPENVVDVLARAKFRTKKELGKLVRELHPLPLIPDSIEPLGRELRAETNGAETNGADMNEVGLTPVSSGSVLPAPARVNELRAELPPITAPQQYQMQFSTTEEHVKLVERAKALLARRAPGKSLGQLHLDAMKLLVASLEKRRFAVTDRPRKRAETPAQESATSESPPKNPGSRRRSRYIPAAVRRAVFEATPRGTSP